MILDASFFDRDAILVSRELLGKVLCRKFNGKLIAYEINEVESYDGFEDAASHAFNQTNPKRSKVMFGPPGYFYVYLCYGIHWMLNIVTREKGHPSAILIRGCGPFDGPGKVGKAFHINKSLNDKPLKKSTGLWVEDRGIVIPKSKILATPRIGVNYAGPVWSKKPYRFVVKK